MSEQPKWLERAIATYSFHRSKLLDNDKWSLTQTAKILRRSTGSVSEDLLIARNLKNYPTELEKLDHAYQALEFIRGKQKEQDLEEIK